jgi:beta-lactamase regulating signal transducer with metallopeptidase domain
VETFVYLGLGNALLATGLAAAAACAGSLCRRPALTHGLWLLVLLKLVTPPFFPVAVPWPCASESPRGPAGPVAPSVIPALAAEPPAMASGDVAPDEPGPALAEEAGPGVPPADLAARATGPAPAAAIPTPAVAGVIDVPGRPPVPWERQVAWVWLTGAAVWFVLAGFRVNRFRRLLRFARPAPSTVQEDARRLAARLGLARCPGVWLFPGPIPPLLWALAGSPRLLVPEALWHRLTGGQRDALLAHELAHLRRRDHWVRWLELLALGLYWWLPVAWLARRGAREAEEQCCDAWVVWVLPSSAAAYAAALVETVSFLSESRAPLPLAASGIGQVRCLKRRLSMILNRTTPRGPGRLGALALVSMGALLLPLWLSWAPTARTAEAGDPAAPPPVVAPPADAPIALDFGFPVVKGAQRYVLPAAAAPAAADPTSPAQASAAPPQATSEATRPTSDPERLREAQDEVDLLKVQLEGKTAEVQEARALNEKARRHVDRLEKLGTRGAVSNEELEQARADLAVQEARVRGKEAQMKEGQLRLRQAERRLAALRSPGERPRGVDQSPRFRTWVPAEPEAVKSMVPALPRATSPAPAAKDVGQRLLELEQGLAKLQRELEALRRELRQRPDAGADPVRPPDLVVPIPPGTTPAPILPPKREDPRTTPTVPLNKR